MENHRGLPPPCESRESDRQSEPEKTEESNKFEFEADGPQANEFEADKPEEDELESDNFEAYDLEADEPEADDEFDGGDFDLDMFDLDDYAREEFEADNFGALKFEGYNFEAADESEAQETEAQETDSPSSDDSDSSFERPDIYNAGWFNDIYTSYRRSGEPVKNAHRGPDGRLMIAVISQRFTRISRLFLRGLLTNRPEVHGGRIDQRVYPPTERHGGFVFKVVRTKTQSHYNNIDIYFDQELTMVMIWRRNHDGPPPLPREIHEFYIPPLRR